VGKKITISITGRNDDHADNFANRLCTSVKKNIMLLNSYLDYDFEYLITDWCSQGELLYQHKSIKNLLQEGGVKFIIVSPEKIREKFGHERFYQFFAKNVGIRHAQGEWVLNTNADNVFNKQLVIKLNEIIANDNDNEFYRTRWWMDVDSDMDIISIKDCDEGVHTSERGLAPIYSGDFLLAKKTTLIEKSKGHDEVNLKHQTELAQVHMDGEILFNLRNNGVKSVILDNYIFHITHPRSSVYDYHYNRNGYENSDTWGFSELSEKHISKNITELV
jgi:hypothetical protein